MYYQPTLCLHVPVTVSARGRVLAGELFLPKDATSLRLCIVQGETPVLCRRLGSLLSNCRTASLTLHTDSPVSTGEIIGVVDWIRSRRLLRTLAIKIVAPSSDARAVIGAAAHRPVAVSA